MLSNHRIIQACCAVPCAVPDNPRWAASYSREMRSRNCATSLFCSGPFTRRLLSFLCCAHDLCTFFVARESKRADDQGTILKSLVKEWLPIATPLEKNLHIRLTDQP